MSAAEIKKLKKEISRLRELAFKDELTKLYNRRGFKEEAGKFLSEVVAFKNFPERRQAFLVKNFCLIIVDADHFKKINDTYGHDAGDEALKMMSKLITERVREVDVVGRWGGEEILIGLVGASEVDGGVIAEYIRSHVENTPIKHKRKSFNLTVSCGVADLAHAKDFEDLFKQADKALYQAKRAGRNKVVKASEVI